MGAGQDHAGGPGTAARPGLQRLSRTRLVEVDPERIGRWVDNFAVRHGDPSLAQVPGSPDLLTLSAPDGAQAQLRRWPDAAYVGGPGTPGGAGGLPADPSALGAWAEPPSRLGLVLVRRGGYAVGLAEGDRLTAHHCGTRYVQSRTAAGGWSQQRFARRRGNQADALLDTVAARAAQLVLSGRPSALVLGGDKALVRRLLEDPRLRDLGGLPRREYHDLPDPRLTVLQTALRRARCVQVYVTDPPPR